MKLYTLSKVVATLISKHSILFKRSSNSSRSINLDIGAEYVRALDTVNQCPKRDHPKKHYLMGIWMEDQSGHNNDRVCDCSHG